MSRFPEAKAELMHELVTLVVRTTASGTSDEDLHTCKPRRMDQFSRWPPSKPLIWERCKPLRTPVPPVATAQSSYLQHVQATDGTHVPQLKISAARDLQETNVTQGASGVTLLAQSGNQSQSMQDSQKRLRWPRRGAASFLCTFARGKRYGVFLLQFGDLYRPQFEILPNYGHLIPRRSRRCGGGGPRLCRRRAHQRRPRSASWPSRRSRMIRACAARLKPSIGLDGRWWQLAYREGKPLLRNGRS